PLPAARGLGRAPRATDPSLVSTRASSGGTLLQTFAGERDGMAHNHWTGGNLPTFVTHLECSLTGERYPADTLQTSSKAGRPLLVRYDLDGVRRALPRAALATRPQTLWRYRELLPVRRPENLFSLGEMTTPLIPLPRIAARLSKGSEIFVKDEARLPTGSFKARGLALAVVVAEERGGKTVSR